MTQQKKDNESDFRPTIRDGKRKKYILVETYIEEVRKWNYREENIRLWVAALRKAGLPD